MSKHPVVSAVLPHRPPMLLLDAIDAWDGAKIRCRTDIREGSLFVHQGRVRAVVTLEYMAQAVAASVGLKLGTDRERSRSGFLIGVRSLLLHVGYLVVGDRVFVEAERLHGDEALASFRTVAFTHECAVAECTMTVYRGGIATIEEGAS